MHRYNRGDVDQHFRVLCAALSKDPLARNFEDRKPGQWSIDRSARGYRVAECASNGGGEHYPLGERYRPAREFCEAVSFALSVREVQETMIKASVESWSLYHNKPEAAGKRWTLDAGRVLLRDGKPVIEIHRIVDPATLSPVETDDLTSEIAARLNMGEG